MVGAALVVAGSAAAGGVKLPKQQVTPTGNFVTLYAFQAVGSAANADVKICTSAHTPKGTEAIPEFFTLKLSSGAIVHLTSLSPKSPALNVTPLGPKQCVRCGIDVRRAAWSAPVGADLHLREAARLEGRLTFGLSVPARSEALERCERSTDP